MEKWEYMTLAITLQRELDVVLNRLGEQGWELVGFTSQPVYFLVLKRRKQ
jgi:hypothetical protein